MSPTDERTGHCGGCGSETIADGERAGIRAGRLLCSECADREIVFHAECLDCEWEFTSNGAMFDWYHIRQRAQQEANSHENQKRVFENESHEAVWRRVHDLSEEVVADV